jgi:hypothetical protein
MNDARDEKNETISELNTDAILRVELLELKQRLAALEAAQQAVGKARRRLTPKMLALFAAVVLLAGVTIVFGQAAVDSLFVSKEGKVGIGTNAPVSKLHIHGDYQNKGAGGLTLDATDNNNPEQYVLRINPFALGDSMIGYQFQTKSTIGGTQIPLTLDNQGRVGIGATPTNRLSVAGNADVSGSLSTSSVSTGSVNATTALRADGASFLFANGASDSTNNVVLRKDSTNAYIFPWGTGTTSNTVMIGGGSSTNFAVSGNMSVGGNLNSTGRYQRDDNPEGVYQVSPRYHMSLTAAAYGGRTRQIPQQVINDLCGDKDGCEVRLGMTLWDNNASTQTASITGVLYYSIDDGRWRASDNVGNAEGVDGSNGTQHAMNAWNTCFFTDGSYSNYADQGDSQKGMSLLVWNGYGNAGRTCELTLID